MSAVDGTVRHEPQVDLSRIDSTHFGPVTAPLDAAFVVGQPVRVDRLAKLRRSRPTSSWARVVLTFCFTPGRGHAGRCTGHKVFKRSVKGGPAMLVLSR